MTLLYIISLIAIVIQILSLTIAVGKSYLLADIKYKLFRIRVYFIAFLFLFFWGFTAAGLYYVAELVEEYTVIAKKAITIVVLFVTTVFFLFMFVDNLPWSMIICGLVSQVLHAIILTDFPYVKLLSVQFIGTIVMLFVNHYLAFKHFTLQYYNFTEVNLFSFNSEKQFGDAIKYKITISCVFRY